MYSQKFDEITANTKCEKFNKYNKHKIFENQYLHELLIKKDALLTLSKS